MFEAEKNKSTVVNILSKEEPWLWLDFELGQHSEQLPSAIMQ